MRALLDYIAVLHYEYHVATAYRRESMGDDETCSALHNAVEGFLYLHLRAGIYRRRSLVEYQHRLVS